MCGEVCGNWDDWDGEGGKWKIFNGERIGGNCVGPGITFHQWGQ